MKIAFDSTYHWDFSAPTFEAESVLIDGYIHRYRVECPYCKIYHFHGPRDGHREAHCTDVDSPFFATGYNIQLSD